MAVQWRWENSLRLDFSALPVKPGESEVHDLLGKIVDCKSNLLRAHLNAIDFCVYLQMSSQEQARECVVKHQGKHGKTIEGVYYTFDIQLLDGASDLKVLDLPYYVTNEMIEQDMARQEVKPSYANTLITQQSIRQKNGNAKTTRQGTL
uniref:Uncharacterized protein n=1 Tax=Anopheles atroparvus TaxID=41427 RepID=A0A182J6H6_ANOAO